MTDLDKAYLSIRNNMVDRIDLFEADMRDAIATGECAVADGDLSEEYYMRVMRDLTREMADLLIGLGTDALLEIIKAERSNNEQLRK